MRIRRSKPVDNFTIIPNTTLRDERLSYCARGILVELLSRPSGWEASADALSERARRHRGDTVGEGRRALRAAFKELEAAGYMLRQREQDERGRFVTVLEVFDTPQDRGTADRHTVRGTSADGTSVRGTSASGTSSISTEGRSTEEEDSFEEDATASSVDPLPDAPATSAIEGGGGGGSLDDSRSLAEHIAGALDYRGKVPDRRQRKTIADRLAAALDGGWSVDGLALYLDLGDAAVNSPAAVYAHRLHPDRLPDAAPLPAPPRPAAGVFGALPTAAEIEALTVADVFATSRRDAADGGMWDRAMARARERMNGPRGGTDDRVAGWAAVGRQLAAREPHRPYSDDPWHAPADPDEAAKIPWCGEIECDPVTRLRDVDMGNGLKASGLCEKCHPGMRF